MAEYMKMTIEVPQKDSDAALGLLAMRDITEVMIEDRRDVENLEIPANHWARIDEKLLESMPDNVRITAYFAPEEMPESRMQELQSVFREHLPAAQCAFLREELGDWENSWKDMHSVVYAGERFVIYPPWEEIAGEGRFAIQIDPGMAFGTGGHATTVLCLELIEKINPRQKRIADIGTGSGILAIACALLGNAVIGIDIDADCVKEARRNAEVNGQTEISFMQGDMLDMLTKKVDLIIANIIDDAVLAMLPVAHRCLEKGGWFIGSGIESGRWPEIAAMLQAEGYTQVDMRERDGWCAFRAVLV